MNSFENFTKDIDVSIVEIKQKRDLQLKNSEVHPHDISITLGDWDREVGEALSKITKYYNIDHYPIPARNGEAVFNIDHNKTKFTVATLKLINHPMYGLTIYTILEDYKAFDNKEKYCKTVGEALGFIEDRLKQVVIFEETGEIK